MSTPSPPDVKYTPKEISSWGELYNFYRDNLTAPRKDWICRGQCGDWPLETTLERACKSFNLELKDARNAETKLIREFRRRYHLYATHIPEKQDTLEWLALMQHFGAPTRLLDWTYSFFVAVYFAFEKKLSKGDKYVVWCIDNGWLLGNVWETLQKTYGVDERTIIDYAVNRDPDSFNSLFIDYPRKLVCSVNPFRYNERLTIQQGIFLCPSDIGVSFQENLAFLNAFSDVEEHVYKLSLVDNERAEFKQDALRHLNRMNMNRATLFPGLQGFAESLGTRLPQLAEIFLGAPRPRH